jgi:hypothetical protein
MEPIELRDMVEAAFAAVVPVPPGMPRDEYEAYGSKIATYMIRRLRFAPVITLDGGTPFVPFPGGE